MGASSFKLSLPRSLRDYLEEQVRKGAHGTPSDYVRALIDKDRKRVGERKLQSMLEEALESKSKEMTDDEWADLKENLLRRHTKEPTS